MPRVLCFAGQMRIVLWLVTNDDITAIYSRIIVASKELLSDVTSVIDVDDIAAEYTVKAIICAIGIRVFETDTIKVGFDIDDIVLIGRIVALV